MASDYFGEQIEKGEPILPPNETLSETPSDIVEAQIVDEWQGLPVRAGGDRIFILKNGKKHWVQSAEAYTRLGFKFGDEVKIDQATLDVLEEGDIIL